MTDIPEDIGQFVRYDATTGKLFWLVDVGAAREGDEAGNRGNRGYLKFRLRGRYFVAHRVAWFLATGEQPPERIDHKDLDRANNRLGNLRPATPTQNNANCRSKRDGMKGVTKLRSGRYQAQVKCRGKNHYLGSFGTEDEAAEAYASKAAELFGEFARAA